MLGLITTVLVGGLLIWMDLATIDKQIAATSERQLELIATHSIADIVLEDQDALQARIEDLKSLDDRLLSIELLSADDKLLASSVEVAPGERSISSSRELVHGRKLLGRLEMTWSFSKFSKPIVAAKLRALMVSFIAILSFVVVLSLVLQWYLVQPLSYLERKVLYVGGQAVELPKRPALIARELRSLDVSLDRTAEAFVAKASAEAMVLREQSRAETAESAAKAKMDFLSLMSHEIRTPLGAMIGFGELLRTANLTKDERRLLESMHSSGRFLLRIINDILDLSKIEADGLVIESLPIDAGKLLGDLKRMVQPLADEAGLDLVVECTGLENKQLVGDRHRLTQVLMNLVGNALKFTEEGTVEARIDASRTDELNVVMVRFEVRDTGIGMSPEQCEKIFQRFAQADSSVNRRFGGTGLGLSIATELVQKMGGKIAVESEVGRGSTFSFELRLGIVDVVDEALAPELEEPSGALAARQLRILVAEDEEVNRILIDKIFASMGQTVEFVHDGFACVDRLLNGIEFDIVFVDLHMPHVGGMEIARKLRAGELGEFGRTLKLAVMSADVLAEQEGHEMGIDAFISKPIDQLKLKRFLCEVAAAPPSPPEDQMETIKNQGLNILVVEDQVLNRELIGQQLRRIGIEACFAEDGIACLEFLANRPRLDAILLDLRMPRMDGITVARRIRAAFCGDGYSNIPIAMITAEVFDQQVFNELRIDEYIPKPVDVNQLETFLGRLKKPERGGVELSS